MGVSGPALQMDLEQIDFWSNQNKMSINANKCEVIHTGNKNPGITYTLSGEIVANTNKIKDLGITVDDQLKFTSHFSIIQSKCLRLIGFIFKSLHSRNQSLYLTYFSTCILPVVEYSSFIYVGISKKNDTIIEKIQRIFTRRLYRRMFNRKPVPVYNERLKLFSLEPITIHILKINLVTLYKIKLRLIRTRSLNLRHGTLHTNSFLIPSINSALYRNSFVIRH